MDEHSEAATRNQQALAQSIDRLNDRLEALLAGDTVGDDLQATSPRLDRLAATFHLSDFEKTIVLWTAGVDLDRRCADLTGNMRKHLQKTRPTLGLALAVLPDAHWSALIPTAPLRHWKMVDLRETTGLSQADLHLDERILHYLAGIDYLDARISHLVRPIEAEAALVQSQLDVVQRLTTCWNQASPGGLPVVELIGEDASSLLSIAAAAAAKGKAGCFVLDAAMLPSKSARRDVLERLWEREAILSGRVLVIDRLGLEAADRALQSAAVDFCRRLRTPLIVCGRERLTAFERSRITFEVPRPKADEQALQWRQALGAIAPSLNGTIDRLVSQFNLSGSAIRAAARQIDGLDDAAGADSRQKMVSDRLWSYSREQARPALDRLAQRIEARVGWEDLVVPPREKTLLHDLADQLKVRYTVYHRWQMGRKSERGLGISALFSGPSGTGKTLAAEVIANALDLDLYRIDLSQVVSKYIGETEKNLGRIFDAAETGGAVLLFDEADALFGQRSEVKDSHDRYANIEVSYLLQRMEAYQGLAILTTNMKQALDSAFLRRLRFVVPFRFPDAAQRAAIWQRMFPPETPTRGLDWEKLGQVSVTGGNIRSIAVNGAFYAASAGEPVSMEHLLRAARAEYAKLERTLSGSEIKGWS